MIDLNDLIEDTCNEYVTRWKTEGKKYISVPSFEQIYAEGNITPIEQESLIAAKLRKLSITDSQMPSAIPQLPLQILRELSVCLTKTLEIQVNYDHYEYWAYSAQVFTYFKDISPLLKTLEEKDLKPSIIDLSFHVCLAKIGYAPTTPEARVLNSILEAVVSRHLHHMVMQKFILGAAVASIALEATLKAIISDVETAKEKLERLEKSKKATLGPTLDIFEKDALPLLSQELRNDIHNLNRVVENTWKTYGYVWREIILNWRNNLMHGVRTWIPRAFGVLTNYICLLLWHSIPNEQYNSRAKELLDHIEWQRKLPKSQIGYWNFYPP